MLMLTKDQCVVNDSPWADSHAGKLGACGEQGSYLRSCIRISREHSLITDVLNLVC